MSEMNDSSWWPDIEERLPTPGERGECAECRQVLIAKCGEINRWHWAHEADAECVASFESAWHQAWKCWARTKGADTEVTINRLRADAVFPDGPIMEFQRRPLDTKRIRQRESVYGSRLTWLYRWEEEHFDRLINDGDGWFRWWRPARSMLTHARPIMIHYRDRLYTVAALVEDESRGVVRLRFERGADDNYGPVLYGSKPAPFLAEPCDEDAPHPRQYLKEHQ